ncbi:hypothetical protein FACS189440_17360 [Bacteroidia bacterium]|nr:hypothetical protein FACS189440_17360 [Bacteroidia bacterium]
MKTSGLDVPKDSIFCAIYDGKSSSGVKEFTTTTVSIRSLGDYLRSEKVQRVAMESTSTYWVPIRDILYEMEFELKLSASYQAAAGQKDRFQRRSMDNIDNLTTLPGVSLISAMIIVSETGGDMSVFENSGKFTGWTGVRPRNDESAGKFKSTATTKGNKHLRAIIVQVARAASRSKRSYFMDKFQKLAMRKPRKKGLVAIGRKMLVIIWHILSEKTQYDPHPVHIYDPVKVEHKIKYHEREIERAKKLIA